MNFCFATGLKIASANRTTIQPPAGPWTLLFRSDLKLYAMAAAGFVNCTREVLIKDYMTLLPSPLAVAEVLESMPADDLVIAALKRLKEAGYMLAVDDFTVDDPRTPLTEMAES